MTPALRETLKRPDVANFLVQMQMHDLDTHWHLLSVAELAYRVAYELRLDAHAISRTADGGLLHDVGKIRINPDILTAPRSLTKDEYLLIKQHPSHGAAIVEAWGFPEVAQIVLDHHERIDGSGYPSGKRKISVETQIVSAADAYDTMRYQRSYKGARSQDNVLDALGQCAGRTHDRVILNALARVITTYEGASRETRLRAV